MLISGSGSYIRQEYSNFFTGEYSTKNRVDFNSLWLGFIYTGDSIADFVPQLTFQTALVQRERAFRQDKNFYLKSQSIRASLKGYSDPVVYGIYAGFGYNQARKFKIAKIQYGNTLYVGGNLSIVLSPKITLDLEAEQRFQTKRKIDGFQDSGLRSIPTLSLGSTYSINADTAISVSADFGGSSAAPDGVFGLSLWKKF